MPLYRVVTSPTYINGNMHTVGDEVEYAGWPGSTLEPIDDVASRIKDHFDARKRDRKAPRAPDLAQFAEAPAPEPVKEKETHLRRNTTRDDK